MTRQPVGKNPNVKHSGESVLRGPMPKLRDATGTAKKPAALGQTVLPAARPRAAASRDS